MLQKVILQEYTVKNTPRIKNQGETPRSSLLASMPSGLGPRPNKHYMSPTNSGVLGHSTKLEENPGPFFTISPRPSVLEPFPERRSLRSPPQPPRKLNHRHWLPRRVVPSSAGLMGERSAADAIDLIPVSSVNSLSFIVWGSNRFIV